MGRPKVPIEHKIVVQTIRLKPEVADAVCRYALRRNVSVYRLLGDIVEKVFAKQVYSTTTVIVYGSVSSSSTVVAARRASGVSSARLG